MDTITILWADDDIDLGTASLQFKNGYFDGTLESDAINVGGTYVLTGEDVDEILH